MRYVAVSPVDRLAASACSGLRENRKDKKSDDGDGKRSGCVIPAVHIILPLLCGEQKRHNPARVK
jgi:hypothetical protein